MREANPDIPAFKHKSTFVTKKTLLVKQEMWCDHCTLFALSPIQLFDCQIWFSFLSLRPMLDSCSWLLYDPWTMASRRPTERSVAVAFHLQKTETQNTEHRTQKHRIQALVSNVTALFHNHSSIWQSSECYWSSGNNNVTTLYQLRRLLRDSYIDKCLHILMTLFPAQRLGLNSVA